MNNDVEVLRSITMSNRDITEERYTYTLEEVYDSIIFPILVAAARDGQDSLTTSRWTLRNIIPIDIMEKDLIKYIQEEKNIRIKTYGDTISFFW